MSEPSTSLSRVLQDLKPDDLEVDDEGRVVINRPEIGQRIQAAVAAGVEAGRRMDSVNQSGCANTQCLTPANAAERITNPVR